MHLTQHEAGYVPADDHLHASQKKIGGPIALCGAGRIAQTVPGRFDPDDPLACPECLRLASAQD